MAKLLLIEDEPGVHEYFLSAVSRMGHEITIADNGAKGYEMAADPSVDMILTDLNMPGSPSGMELVRKVREARPECPIVVVSGYPTRERLEECKQLGIADFLTKPFEMSFFQSVIERLLPGESKAADRKNDEK